MNSWVGGILLLSVVLGSLFLMLTLGIWWYPLGIFIGVIPWATMSLVMNLGENEDKQERRIAFQKKLAEIRESLHRTSANSKEAENDAASKAHEEFMAHINAMNESAARTMEAVRRLQELQGQLFPKKDEDPSAA